MANQKCNVMVAFNGLFSQSIGWLDNINVILCCQNMTYHPLYELSIKIKFVILIIV